MLPCRKGDLHIADIEIFCEQGIHFSRFNDVAAWSTSVDISNFNTERIKVKRKVHLDNREKWLRGIGLKKLIDSQATLTVVPRYKKATQKPFSENIILFNIDDRDSV